MTGKSSIALAAGLSSKGKLGENGCLVISRWVEEEKRFRVSVGYEGENLKAGIWYELDENGNFKECE